MKTFLPLAMMCAFLMLGADGTCNPPSFGATEASPGGLGDVGSLWNCPPGKNGPCAIDADCCSNTYDPHYTCAGSHVCEYHCTPKPGAGFDGDPCTVHEDCVSCWCDEIGGCVDHDPPPDVQCGELADFCGDPGDPDCCPGLVCLSGVCELTQGN